MDSLASRFYNRAKSHLTKDSDLPGFFVFHLTIEMDHRAATVQNIQHCYSSCDMKPPSWLGSYMSNGLKSSPRRFIKVDGGYRLENKRRDAIAKLLGTDKSSVQTSAALNRLEANVAAGPKREFLRETISCFEVGANRAAVVMCWNLGLHHLQEFVMADATRLLSFNDALAKNTDTRVKIKAITKQDDFTEMPENKFLLFCREAKIITSSMFKKLEGRLDERNLAAHPSGVKVTPKTAEAYIEDVIENVVMKFTI